MGYKLLVELSALGLEQDLFSLPVYIGNLDGLQTRDFDAYI